MSAFRIDRRRFLKSATLATGSLAFPHVVVRAAEQSARSANSRINLAFIGVGGQGRDLVRSMTDENYVAFCDVDDRRAARSYEQFPDVPRFKDFRVMLDKLGDQIDAVAIAVPDHTHCVTAIGAMQRGKHVYVEKPLARTIMETRWMHDVARQTGVITQLGIQGHSFTGLRVLREWIDGGVVGSIREVYLWTNRPDPRDVHDFDGVDAPAEPIPDGLDWDLWLGPARDRAYNRAYVPTRWRGWWELSSGSVGNIGLHMWDTVEFALDLGFPTRVTGERSRASRTAIPGWSILDFEYAARGTRPPITVHWFSGYDGEVQKWPQEVPHWPAEREKDINGMAFVGSEGTLYIPDMRASTQPLIFPEERSNEVRGNLPPRTLRRPRGGHYADWLDAIRDDRRASADFDYSAPLTESVLLGNLALRTGKPIEWDGASLTAQGVPEAKAFVTPHLRPGWEVET